MMSMAPCLKNPFFVLYEDGEPVDIAWHDHDGSRNFLRHPESRKLQEMVVKHYEQRMAREGLSFDRSGQPWAVWSAKRKFPARAISFDHRAESYYRQREKNSGNHYILQATRSGLRRVRMLAHRTPMFIIRYLVLRHNKEHGGSPNSVLDMGAEAIKLEAGWKAYARKNGITTKDNE
jgi:hypothetical protein